MELVFFFWILCGIAGAAILSRYDNAGTGCLLGGLLGPIGLLIAWTMRDSRKLDEVKQLQKPPRAGEPDPSGRSTRQCPHCAEVILAEAKLCRYCRSSVDPSLRPDIAGRLSALKMDDRLEIWFGIHEVEYDCGHTVSLSLTKDEDPPEKCPECVSQGRK